MDIASESWIRSPPSSTSPDVTKSSTTPKKPRHRHSPTQLAALNELFEKTEHPSLEQRIALAERLGMETKTVNAWFQNKRASSKKRFRNHLHSDSRTNATVAAPSASSASSNLPHVAEFDDYHDDEISSLDLNQSRFVPDLAQQNHPSAYISGNGDVPRFMTDADFIPRRIRAHPSQEQIDELKNIYNANPHPSAELRQALSERLGMRYQSITNWFQNQRSVSKKRTHEEMDAGSRRSHYVSEKQHFAYPPSHRHSSSFPASGSNVHPQAYDRMRGSVDYLLHADESARRKHSPRRYSAPYSTSSSFSRPRRSRPEPYQLDALKELFTKTSTPSIEERSALAAEIGMDIGKVTNWFRNLRQTARKRTRKAGSSEEDDDFSSLKEQDVVSGSFSRPVTPSQHSSSSVNEDIMDLDDCDHEERHSDAISDEEYPEAVTPLSEPLPPVAALKTDLPSYAGLDKLPMTQYHGVKIEDALLLLSFHHHAVH
ncbi:hypothetical protein APHAL10511_005937 [Amanita phalloides]|nr:hypothetical protein APHAL10511_005937 [Amanita phalloides]